MRTPQVNTALFGERSTLLGGSDHLPYMPGTHRSLLLVVYEEGTLDVCAETTDPGKCNGLDRARRSFGWPPSAECYGSSLLNRSHRSTGGLLAPILPALGRQIVTQSINKPPRRSIARASIDGPGVTPRLYFGLPGSPTGARTGAL